MKRVIEWICREEMGGGIYVHDEYVPVKKLVRCKDCKFFDEHMEECHNRKSTACIEGWVYGDWFCADGERSDE